jgi:hypothetical protein
MPSSAIRRRFLAWNSGSTRTEPVKYSAGASMVMEQLRTGRLQGVLEPFAATVPGYFICFPSRARRSAPLRLFVEAARELAVRATSA